MTRNEHEAAMQAQRFNDAVLADKSEAIQHEGQALLDRLWQLGFRPTET